MPGQKASEAQRREEIMRAAYDVASKQGVEALTVRAVAARAAVSHGTVLFHFARGRVRWRFVCPHGSVKHDICAGRRADMFRCTNGPATSRAGPFLFSPFGADARSFVRDAPNGPAARLPQHGKALWGTAWRRRRYRTGCPSSKDRANLSHACRKGDPPRH